MRSISPPRMAFTRCCVVALILILAVSATSSSQSFLQIATKKKTLLPRDSERRGLDLYCESWRFTVETNDAGSWSRVPSRCVNFVKEYITSEVYRSESEAVADGALEYARGVKLSGNGEDAWVFDIDETLLSNVPYYADHGFGKNSAGLSITKKHGSAYFFIRSDIYDEQSFDEWVDLAQAPVLPASLRLYKGLRDLGFTIILLTGRSEFQRNVTGNNLRRAGYSNWERLYLRGDSDQGTLASVYKSEKRKELEDEGYIIHGNSGDQWSDLMGFAVAKRSFKLPNPMYFIA